MLSTLKSKREEGILLRYQKQILKFLYQIKQNPPHKK